MSTIFIAVGLLLGVGVALDCKTTLENQLKTAPTAWRKQQHARACSRLSKNSPQSSPRHPPPAHPAPAATWPRSIPKYKSEAPFGFVHIPKTGGTAMKDFLLTHRNQCPALVFTSLHDHNEAEWQRLGYESVVVLRDPAERFRSAFDYARGGSEKYATTHMSGEAAKFADVNDFADALRSGQASMSNLAWQIVQLREHGIQFRAAATWLNGNATKRHVVCFSGSLTDGLSKAVNDASSKRRRANNGGDRGASSSLKGTCGIRAGKRNVSKKHSAKISNANLKWVRSYYRSDYALFRRYCGTGL